MHSTSSIHDDSLLSELSSIEKAESNCDNESSCVLEGIKNFLAVSRKIKQKDRANKLLCDENNILRDENETLLQELRKFAYENSQLRQESSKSHESQEGSFDEIKPGLHMNDADFDEERSLYIKELERIKEQMKESDNQKKHCEKKIKELEEIVKDFKLETNIMNELREVEKVLAEESDWEQFDTDANEKRKMLLEKQLLSGFQTKLLTSQMQIVREHMIQEQQKREEAEQMVSKLKLTIQQLEEDKIREQVHTAQLEQESLEIDCLRNQFELLSKDNDHLRKTSEKLDIDDRNTQRKGCNESRLEKNLTALAEEMEKLVKGRRISELPKTLQSDPPPSYQSAETFHQMVELLKIVLSDKKVTTNQIQDFWNSLLKRVEVMENVLNEKVLQSKKSAYDEIWRIDNMWKEEKDGLLSEIHETKKLSEKRLSAYNDLNQKYEAELKEKDKEISSLTQWIEIQKKKRSAAHESTEPAVSEKIKIKKQFSEIATQTDNTWDNECSHHKHKEEMQKLTTSFQNTEKDLKKKMVKVEEELIAEQRSRQYEKVLLINAKSALNSTKKELENAVLELSSQKEMLAHANSEMMAIQKIVSTEKSELHLKQEEKSQVPAETEESEDLLNIPEDKQWVIQQFFKDSTD